MYDHVAPKEKEGKGGRVALYMYSVVFASMLIPISALLFPVYVPTLNTGTDQFR